MHYGVNYTPSHGWFFTWLNPDWASVEKDFEQIVSLGLDHVRIFPLWPLLQPNRAYINEKAVSDVAQMVHLAGLHGLNVYVDVIQGHLSSYDFVPTWLVSWHDTNMFTDEKAIQAQAHLVKTVYEACEKEKNFSGLTLGNECNQFTDISHPHRHPATAGQIQNWLEALLSPMEKKAHEQGRILVHSENDAVWYEENHAFTPRFAAQLGDVTTIHSWVFNGVAKKYGPLSFESTKHARYLMDLSLAYSDNPQRQVWLQEAGSPLNVMTAGQAPEFCSQTVRAALSHPQAYGVTWWCSHDVSSQMADFPNVEYSLGLFDEHGQLKEVGKAYRDTIARCRDEFEYDENSKQNHDDHHSTTALVVPTRHGEPVMRAAQAAGGSVFTTWMNIAKQGEMPQIISSEKAHDARYCSSRGIHDLVEVQLEAGDAYEAVSDPSLAEKKSQQ